MIKSKKGKITNEIYTYNAYTGICRYISTYIAPK